jgi:hypothetical protein
MNRVIFSNYAKLPAQLQQIDITFHNFPGYFILDKVPATLMPFLRVAKTPLELLSLLI